MPGVGEATVIGARHPDFGEAVTAIVVPEPGATVDGTSVVTALADTLAKFKQSNALIVADQPPRNTMVKAQKRLLRESHAHLLSD